MMIKHFMMGIIAALLAAGCGSGSSSESAGTAPSSTLNKGALEQPASEWYVRLVAEDAGRGMITQSAQLGILKDPDALEKQSLKALSPFSGNYLDIVFTDPEGLMAGDYKSVFRVYQTDAAQSWQFTIRSDDTHANIVVTWRGLYVLTAYLDNQGRTRYKEYRSLVNPLLKKMQVVDETTGEVLPVVTGDAMTAFVVNMNGATTRTFRWELLTEDTQAVASAAQSVKAVETAQVSAEKALHTPQKPSIDLNKPPVFDERK